MSRIRFNQVATDAQFARNVESVRREQSRNRLSAAVNAAAYSFEARFAFVVVVVAAAGFVFSLFV